MRQSSELANKLIFGLYRAAEDVDLLQVFLSDTANAFNGHIVGLRGHDRGYSNSRYFKSFGFPLQDWMGLESRLTEGHPWRKQGFEDMMRDGFGHSGTILPDRELQGTEFHHLVLKPMKIAHGMGICLWTQPPDQMVVLSINRAPRSGSFVEADMRFAKALLPHFRSAYAIMRRLGRLESKAQSLIAAFDRLDIGLVLVDAQGKCSYRNARADVALHDDAGICLSAADLFRCASVENQHKLLDALRNAALGLLRQPEHIHIRDASGALRYVLVVAMLHSDLISGAAGDAACAAIFVHERSAPTAQPQAILSETYRLTPAEARLASLLVTDLQPKECAEVLGISMPTVRTQLHNLLIKTGARRQSELISHLNFALRAK